MSRTIKKIKNNTVAALLKKIEPSKPQKLLRRKQISKTNPFSQRPKRIA